MRREFALKNDPQIPGGVAGQIAASGLPLIALKPMLTNVRFAPRAVIRQRLCTEGQRNEG